MEPLLPLMEQLEPLELPQPQLMEQLEPLEPPPPQLMELLEPLDYLEAEPEHSEPKVPLAT